jgi:hypothetical protein
MPIKFFIFRLRPTYFSEVQAQRLTSAALETILRSSGGGVEHLFSYRRYRQRRYAAKFHKSKALRSKARPVRSRIAADTQNSLDWERRNGRVAEGGGLENR